MRRLLQLLPLFFLPLLSHPVLSEVIDDLYEVRVPVNDQSDGALEAAARKGLSVLFVRVSGQTDAAAESALKSALANPQRYLDQYRFERTPPGLLAEGEEAQPFAAVLQFAPEPVDELLRKAGLPVWGANRPLLMVWLAKEQDGNVGIVNETSHPELVASLRTEAKRRGVLLQFPLLDLEDLGAISADQVWRLDGLALAAASARYPVDAVLAGRVTELTDGRWLGSWRLSADESRTNIDIEGVSREAYLGRGVDAVATALAARYAAPVGEAGLQQAQLQLEVAGIDEFQDYAGVLSYLQRLDQVRDVDLIEVQADRLLLRLRADGGAQYLQRLLALDSRLQPADETVSSSELLRYRWQRPRG